MTQDVIAPVEGAAKCPEGTPGEGEFKTTKPKFLFGVGCFLSLSAAHS